MNKLKPILIPAIIIFSITIGIAQPSRWQQAVDYTMSVNLNVKNHSFSGEQHLVYANNSPDTLYRLFYHLYFNAFQPGSMMDERSRNIEDPDRRVKDRISKLSDTEMGKLYPISLTLDNEPVTYKVSGTILEVTPNNPIMPNSEVSLDMRFDGQVPIQIRRSGRNNKEGISYSMSQWYPKLCQYDLEGWHANPYVAREFYGVWGNFDVTITIDSKFIVAASGVIQNGNEIGYGYEEAGVKVKKHDKLISYHFKAENVHDFMWAADPDYVHEQVVVPDGPVMHYFYQKDDKTSTTWPQLMEISPKMVHYMNERFGTYPYPVFNVIQGGDGGMEYPMSTLIMGRGDIGGLVGVTVHEMFHSWYQGVLGSNESLYPWLDEGFTSYATTYTMQYLFNSSGDPLKRFYNRYFALIESGKQEPMTTHSDHYNTNFAYGTAAYTMGAMVLSQLSYIIGDSVFQLTLKNYFNTWKFKHPNPTDFKRVMEKGSGLELDWFLNDWIATTKHVDYAIKSVQSQNDSIEVLLENRDQRPMPAEVMVTYKSGKKERYYFPLRMMRGVKQFADDIPTTMVSDWPWTHPVQRFMITADLEEIESVVIDPEGLTADIDTTNNSWMPNK